ncbi:hypothetical protein BS333_17250 [Vibrio azureus]|uniref:Knr4/Smi1-like domain-containing protein n=2 Tax=Vibrio azureus TaxID=512649 RepID=U3AMK3_9VIBR|nr:SUKH-3 domain-containing protein [Vibrio azureus]AUI88110.1 hypothetical protein BS333_17250 [Vibrio azureus]GAD75000.1 hypothetical protein VAZ01S_017_00950 [Vibrio azureus NBRC 104587]
MQQKTEEYLTSMGWSSERMVELPEEYSAYSISDNAKSILRNIYGLTLISKTGQKRLLRLTSRNFDCSKRDIQEMIEDYKLPLDLYPIGSLSELGGYLYLDKNGDFYYLEGQLIFLGSNLDEFIETMVFNERDMIGIDEPDPCYCFNYPEGVESKLIPSQRLTYYNSKTPAPWLYDTELGLIPLKTGFWQRLKSFLRMTK